MAKNKSRRRALITGISGQDGAYLSKLLLEQGYEVFGGLRRSATRNLWRLDELGLTEKIRLVDFELSEFSNILNTIRDIKPHEIYNFASNSDVAVGHRQPLYTGEVDALGVTRILEAIRINDDSIRFYQASSSEMFGNTSIAPQSEQTPFQPHSPYGIAKLYAHWTTVNYREAYNIFATSGILYNHESPLRGTGFVTRKVTSGLAKIRNGQADCIYLGNLDAERD
jgi:GDPmannose 4,6-dehydratase